MDYPEMSVYSNRVAKGERKRERPAQKELVVFSF